MEHTRSWATSPSRVFGFVALVVVWFSLAGVVAAAPILVANFSFEAPLLADGAFTPPGVVSGWVVAGASGAYNPSFAQLTQGATDGLQVGYSNNNGVGFRQDLGAVLTANTLYTLQVDVQSRTDGPGADHAGSTLQLRTAANDVLASSSVGPLLGGTNFLLTTSFFAGVADLNLGETLRIVLIAAGTQSDWDNVRLDATDATDVTAAPEPTTMLLWGTTAVGLAAVTRWRRRRRPA